MVIGILAAITIVSYSGTSQRATVAAMQSDLDNASKTLKLYYTLYSSYPTALSASNCPTTPTTDANYCLKFSGSNTISYNGSTNAFSLVETNGTTYYKIDNNSVPTVGNSLDWSLVFNLDAGNSVSYSGSGSAWSDISGGGHNGTIINNVTYSSIHSGVLIFGGGNDYVAVPGPIINTAGNFTAEGWVNLYTLATTGGEGQSIIVGNYNAAYKGYILGVGTGGSPLFKIGRQSTSSDSWAVSPTTITINTWHHIVGLYDGVGAKIYVDGVLKNSTTYSPIEPETADTRIGGGQWNAPRAALTGQIGGIRVYNRALSASEVSQRFNDTKSRYGL